MIHSPNPISEGWLGELRAQMEDGALLGQGAQSFDGVITFPLTEDSQQGDYLTIGDVSAATDTRNIQLSAEPSKSLASSVLFVLRPVLPDSHVPHVLMPAGGRRLGIPRLPYQARGLILDINPLSGRGRMAAILNNGDQVVGKKPDMSSMYFDIKRPARTELERVRFITGFVGTLANCVAKTRQQRQQFTFGLANLVAAQNPDDSSRPRAA